MAQQFWVWLEKKKSHFHEISISAFLKNHSGLCSELEKNLKIFLFVFFLVRLYHMLIGWYSSQGRIAQCSRIGKKFNFKCVHSPVKLHLFADFVCEKWFHEIFCTFFLLFRALCIVKLVVVTQLAVSTHIGKHVLYNFWQLKIEINASTSTYSSKIQVCFKELFSRPFFLFDSIKNCTDFDNI